MVDKYMRETLEWHGFLSKYYRSVTMAYLGVSVRWEEGAQLERLAAETFYHAK